MARPGASNRRKAIGLERSQLLTSATRKSLVKKLACFTLAIVLAYIELSAAGVPGSLAFRAPRSITLEDQYGHEQTLSFPSTNIVILTIADKRGSEQIGDWIKPLKAKYGHQIEIRGIADVSAVPKPFRSLVRKKFQGLQSYPVMMDWSGNSVKAFTYVPGKANVLLIDYQGRVLERF